jgi:hypothetical protein
MIEQGKRTWDQHRGANPLYCPRADQHVQAQRRPARHRGHDENNETGNKQTLGAEPVAESTGCQDQAGEEDGVSIDDPLQSCNAAAERRPNSFERDVHDRDVELHHCKAETHRGKRQRR